MVTKFRKMHLFDIDIPGEHMCSVAGILWLMERHANVFAGYQHAH